MGPCSASDSFPGMCPFPSRRGHCRLAGSRVKDALRGAAARPGCDPVFDPAVRSSCVETPSSGGELNDPSGVSPEQ
jgi:hypothetical protein